LIIEEGAPLSPTDILTSPRIGITKATHLPWRFYLKDNPYVSKTPAAFAGEAIS
jgi:DNA-3-methyladenine glycosylase